MMARRTQGTKPNPLTNKRAMAKLNPYSTVLRQMRQKDAGVKRKISKADRKAKQVRSKVARGNLKGLLTSVETEVDALTGIYREQIASMNVNA